MPPKSKSIFRQPGVQHFQLVHRSQRDPLISDPSASSHVFKSFEPANQARKHHGKTRAELEDLLGEEVKGERKNVGEAALYGIYYDDTAYDYMQHLRPIGAADEGEGVIDSVLIEAPSASRSKGKGKGKERDLELRLPADVLPSEKLRTQQEAQDALLAIPQALAGFNPSLDPHLRQTLEALEDDAFVVPEPDEEEEDFFAQLVGGGEAEEGEREEWEFEEWGVDEDGGMEEEGDDLTRRVRAFKRAQKEAEAEAGSDEEELDEEADEPGAGLDPGKEGQLEESEIAAIRARLSAFKLSHRPSAAAAGSDAWSDTERGEDYASEAGSTLPPLPVIGGKRRRKGAYSDASGFSMSSSSVFRTAGQKLVDDRFDHVERAYEDDGDEDEEKDEEDEDESEDDDDEPPTLINSRQDFESVIDGFMAQYEQVGSHVRPASEKLDTLRRALAQELRVEDLEGSRKARAGEGDEEIPMPKDIDVYEDAWDVETILSTYSNLENHPRVIGARVDVNRGIKRIRLDGRTGLPTVEEEGSAGPSASHYSRRVGRDAQSSPEKRQKLGPPRVPVARAKDESKEEKKARKAAVKQERQERRAEKKATKSAFSAERKNQLRNVPAVAVSAVAIKL